MQSRDDEDPLAAAAAASLAIGIGAAERVAGDDGLAAWVAELRGLPPWRDNPKAWLAELSRIRARYRLPAAAELERRSLAQALLNRLCSDSERAADPKWDSGTRHRSLVTAAAYAGMLFTKAGGSVEIDTAIKSALSANATRAAQAKHKENNIDKRTVLSWADAKRTEYAHKLGRFAGRPNLDAMADAIMDEEIVAVTRPTVRRWLTAWLKEGGGTE